MDSLVMGSLLLIMLGWAWWGLRNVEYHLVAGTVWAGRRGLYPTTLPDYLVDTDHPHRALVGCLFLPLPPTARLLITY